MDRSRALRSLQPRFLRESCRLESTALTVLSCAAPSRPSNSSAARLRIKFGLTPSHAYRLHLSPETNSRTLLTNCCSKVPKTSSYKLDIRSVCQRATGCSRLDCRLSQKAERNPLVQLLVEVHGARVASEWRMMIRSIAPLPGGRRTKSGRNFWQHTGPAFLGLLGGRRFAFRVCCPATNTPSVSGEHRLRRH